MGLAKFTKLIENMKEAKLLEFCRYYNGNNINEKKGSFAICVIAERAWVNFSKSYQYGDNNPFLDRYLEAGLANFCLYDETPITLKAHLFAFYCKVMDFTDIKGFMEFYRLHYTNKVLSDGNK